LPPHLTATAGESDPAKAHASSEPQEDRAVA